MRVSHLVLLLGLLTGGVAQAQNNTVVQSDYRAVPSLRHHLPLSVPEAQGLDDREQRDIECVAWNVYFEARGGTRDEQIAVAYTPLNRIGRPEFGADICTNVFQYGWAGGRRQYQFSWAGMVLSKNWKREDRTWENVQRLAIQVYQAKVKDTANGSTYFHNANLVPGWAPRSRKIRIGSHVFWRMH